MRPFNTGDCLIEVTPLAGLTVYCVCIVISWLKQIVKEGKNILVEFLTGCLQHDPPCLLSVYYATDGHEKTIKHSINIKRVDSKYHVGIIC
jgi:hypothetical protein